MERDFNHRPVPPVPIEEMRREDNHTHFCVWSPDALAARVVLRSANNDDARNNECASVHYPMLRSTYGRWALSLSNECVPLGTFYTFQIRSRRGVWLDETPGIFAKTVSVNGRWGAVIDLSATNPEGWDADERPPMTADKSDAVIYEMHHRDFSISRESGIRQRGKFLALTEHGTCSKAGLSTGIDHLVELGVTHVHLLPSYDFGSIDEAHPERPAYNWGYDPLNYNVPEGSYSTNPFDPSARIREFKQMVLALHRAGIRVVMDVVYNHVYDLKSSNFQLTAPDYFFRWNADGTPSNGSGCGNETASERPMMRKFMIESLLYWVSEYHVDGFRFDLMGLHDLVTMRAIRDALYAVDPTLLLYGEGWCAAQPGLDANLLAMKSQMSKLLGVAAFGDEMRDALRGPWNADEVGSFLLGRPGFEESVKFGIAGAVPHKGVNIQKVNYSRKPWAFTPQQMISYVSCHDDLCLADRLSVTLQAAAVRATTRGKSSIAKSSVLDEAELARLHKLAYTAVLTSRGIPFIWCGDEVMRDRKGVRNCYKSPDRINAIRWSLKARHHDVFDYIRGLIHLRRQHTLSRSRLVFLPVTTSNVVAYQYDFHNGDKQIVILNANHTPVAQRLPKGQWRVVAMDGVCYSDGMAHVQSQMRVASQSAVILQNE